MGEIRHALLNAGDAVLTVSVLVHKVDGVGKALEAAGAPLAYFPAYSPDVNWIERPFRKLKAHLRKAAEEAIRIPSPYRRRRSRIYRKGM